MKAKIKMALYWIIAIMPTTAVLAVFHRLPEEIPMQYDFSGQITRMGSRSEMFLLPAITLLLAAGLRLFSRSLYKSPRGERNRKVFDFTCWIVTIFLGSVSILMLYYAGLQTRGIMQTPAMKILSLMVSAMLIALGNLLPTCKRTGRYWLNIGFRTPWTLRSDMVWAKVNRLGGYAMVAVGFAGIPLSLLLPSLWGLMTVAGLMVLVALWGMIYSWLLYREENMDR